MLQPFLPRKWRITLIQTVRPARLTATRLYHQSAAVIVMDMHKVVPRRSHETRKKFNVCIIHLFCIRSVGQKVFLDDTVLIPTI
jgi:hypothetical protein